MIEPELSYPSARVSRHRIATHQRGPVAPPLCPLLCASPGTPEPRTSEPTNSSSIIYFSADCSACRTSLIPNAPSSRDVITPWRLIVNNHGSVCRWNALSWGRSPFVGWLPT